MKNKVPIKNVLYMFSYIWDRAEYMDFEYLDNNDDFDSANILSELFIDNINCILKFGLYREYKEKEDEIRGIKGKIDFKESINNMSFQNAKAVCRYDMLEENNIINQIIKTTAYKLYKTEELKEKYKRKLNNILLYFNSVDLIDITEKTFNIEFNRNNYYTYYIIMICKLINDSTMLSKNKGKYKFINILDDDERMKKIFELFIYKFYKKELKNYVVYYQKPIKLEVEKGNKKILPSMELDTVLENKENTIIIDTKYYSDFFVKSYYNKEKKLISSNLFQIESYMNNYKTKNNLKGMLLYPVPYSKNEISEQYEIEILQSGKASKAILQVQTINLSKDWKDIKSELLNII